LTDSESIRLKIIEADQRDVGKGIVRISERQMADMGLVEYDVVNIKGGKPTSALEGPVPEGDAVGKVEPFGYDEDLAGIDPAVPVLISYGVYPPLRPRPHEYRPIAS